MNTLTNKITLSGEESIAFVNSLYRPSNEYIQQNKERLGLMEKKIIITETKDGFEAEIKDLDLSFLEKQHEDRKLSREFTRYDNLDITNEKIRKDLTFNYNGKEYLYSYGKDTLTNNNFTLLYENNKSKDEVLRIHDNNLTTNEKYLNENVINK